VLKSVTAGCEELPAGYDLPRHRHLESYAIVVLHGSFEQVSYSGRVRVRAGDLLLQPRLDCHANRTSGARIVRLPWRVDGLGGVYRLADLDAVARAAERDLGEALVAAGAHQPARRARSDDWPDELAAAIVRREVDRLGEWAEQHGLARETVARGFGQAYGVSARRFRAELRARDAWLRLVEGHEPLAEIAAATGFADQPHMSRWIRSLTGRSPAGWRLQ